MSQTIPQQIRIAVFPPDAAPRLETVTNSLEALQTLVGGRIECFPTRVAGVVGICNDEFLFDGSPLNVASLPYGARICGTFLLCGETRGAQGTEFCSLTDVQEFWIQRVPCWPCWELDGEPDFADLEGDPWA